MAGDTRGRKLALTPEVYVTVIEAIEAGNYRHVACKMAGIHRDTLNGWEQRAKSGEEPFAEFVTDLEKAEATCEVRLLSEIKGAQGAIVGVSGPELWQARAWVLERRFPKRWAARVRQNVAEEIGALVEKLQARLPAAVFAQVIDATRDDAPSESSGDARH